MQRNTDAYTNRHREVGRQRDGQRGRPDGDCTSTRPEHYVRRPSVIPARHDVLSASWRQSLHGITGCCVCLWLYSASGGRSPVGTLQSSSLVHLATVYLHRWSKRRKTCSRERYLGCLVMLGMFLNHFIVLISNVLDACAPRRSRNLSVRHKVAFIAATDSMCCSS